MHRLQKPLRTCQRHPTPTPSHAPAQPGSTGAAAEWDIYREVPEDYVNGYAYAIATGSVTILSLFQQRCLAGEHRLVYYHIAHCVLQDERSLVKRLHLDLVTTHKLFLS